MPGGAVCVAGDYAPVWTGCRKKYKVLRKWPQTLWEAHKLSHDVYDDLLFNTRQGVVGAKRNLEAVREHELEREEERELAAVTKRIRANEDLYRPFLKVPEAERWLQKFEKDGLRFPILLVLGPSYAAKTEWSKSLFNKPLELKIGPLKHFPEKMRLFHRGVHDGIVLDDIRDLEFLAEHQHILQGKYDERAEFASTPGDSVRSGGGSTGSPSWPLRITPLPTSSTFARTIGSRRRTTVSSWSSTGHRWKHLLARRRCVKGRTSCHPKPLCVSGLSPMSKCSCALETCVASPTCVSPTTSMMLQTSRTSTRTPSLRSSS